MIGENLHTLRVNWHESAQMNLPGNGVLAQARPCASVLPVGEAAIPVTPTKHLFRTPSLGGQDSLFRHVLPTTFASADPLHTCAHSFADFGGPAAACLRDLPSLSSLTPSGFKDNKGWAACRFHEFGLHWRWLAAWPLVATRLQNRLSSGRPLARAPRRSSTATSLQARLWARRVTSFTANKTPAGAKHRLTDIAGRRARPSRNHAIQPAGRAVSARGFLRASLLKTKDVPCSKRS